MSSVQYIPVKELASFSKMFGYYIIYFYKKSDQLSEELHCRMKYVVSQYPSVTVRVLDYKDLCNEKGREDVDKRLLVVGIYHYREVLTYFDNPNQLLLMKIFYSIDCRVPKTNFVSFVHSLSEGIFTKRLPIQSESRKTQKRKTTSQALFQPMTPKIQRQSVSSPKILNQSVSNDVLDAASILCTMKSPVVIPYVPNVPHSGRTTPTPRGQPTSVIQQPRSRTSASQTARTSSHGYHTRSVNRYNR